jgi:uncharacterized protein (TIGR02147 family)
MLNNSTAPFYHDCLRDELVKRVNRNPRYSLRSFATALGINVSALSLILAGKRSVSIKVIERIFRALELSETEQKKFLESVLAEKQTQGLKRISPSLKTKLSRAKSYPTIDVNRGVGVDEFRVIADWYHYAILELTESKSFRADPKWIARVLQINEWEAKLALERLLKLELLEEHAGSLRKTNIKIDTKDKTKTSLFHRKRQKQILEKSAQSLEQDPIESRNHSSLTFCIDPSRLEEAKKRIQKFTWELAEFLRDGEQKLVYEMNIGLFPLQLTNLDQEKKS